MDKKNNNNLTKKATYKEYLIYIIIILVVILLRMYVFSLIRVNGDSMKKTLIDKDIMILNKISYRFKDIKRLDIVVVKYGKEYIIKRVIGLPGDEIECKENKLYINGKLVQEKYVYTETNDFKIKVDKNEYFVMGDNRKVSIDSRKIGAVNKKDIKGKTNFILFPLKRMGKVN